MSDLLPLVATVLNDRAAAGAQEEIAQLRRELFVSRSVEVVRAGRDSHDEEPITVYASGQFQNGEYSHNPNLWQVDLEESKSSNVTDAVCRLADLRQCRLCVGGGFPMHTLNDMSNQDYEGFCDPDAADSDTSKAVKFCFAPHSVWLTIMVHGWPREEWEREIQDDDLDPEDCIRYLVEEVASRHPEATVEFKYVCFVVDSIHGALKRLLPPKRREQAQAVRDGRRAEAEARRAVSELYHYVAMTMRALGNENGSALFIPQCNQVLSCLIQLGIRERNEDNEEAINVVVSFYERFGQESLTAFLSAYESRGPEASGGTVEEAILQWQSDRADRQDDHQD